MYDDLSTPTPLSLIMGKAGPPVVSSGAHLHSLPKSIRGFKTSQSRMPGCEWMNTLSAIAATFEENKVGLPELVSKYLTLTVGQRSPSHTRCIPQAPHKANVGPNGRRSPLAV